MSTIEARVQTVLPGLGHSVVEAVEGFVVAALGEAICA